MREIKFRAWDKVKKEWIPISSLECFHTGEVLQVKRMWNRKHFSIKSDCILVQFTGLKDKNGKEIWEGDIVQFNDYEWEEYKGRKIFTVELGIPRFWLKEELFGYEGELLKEPENCKVIGNIYENPELLEAK